MSRKAFASIALDYATPAGRELVSIQGERASAAYIDLRFGGRRPIEVINIWDYRADRSTVDNTDAAVYAAVKAWADDQDAEELDYRLADYTDPDDRNEIRAQWAAAPERAWLFTYVANS